MDLLRKYSTLRQWLLEEKATIENRLQTLNAVLGDTRSAVPSMPPRKRIRNENSLADTIRKVTASKPMTRKEILEAVTAEGYRFNTKNPLNSIGVVLYSGKFRNKDGKFSPK